MQPDGHIKQANPAFRHLADGGTVPADAAHLDDFKWMDIRGASVNWRSVFEECTTASHMVYRLGIRHYGQIKHHQVDAYPYRQNGLECLLLLVKPPSAEIQAIAVEESQLLRVMEMMPIMICGWDELRNFRFWNAECEQLTGYAKHEVIGNPDGMALLYPDAAERAQIMSRWTSWQQQSQHRIRDWELEITGKEGCKRAIAWTIQHDDEPFMGLHTWGIGVDVTDRVKIRKALEHSQQRFATISKATNDAVWEWDLATDELSWNDGLTHLFGHPNTKVEENIVWWEGKIHPEDRERVAGRIREFVNRGEDAWSDEYRFCRLDNSYAFVHDKGHIIKDANGKPIRMIGGIQDITERKIFEQNLMLKNTQIAEYVFHNSHRVRAPLARLIGLAHLLSEEHPDIGESKEMIEKLKVAADEIDRMTKYASNMML